MVVTVMGPVTALAGTVAVRDVSEMTVKEASPVPSMLWVNWTAVTVPGLVKPRPVIVTTVPTGPLAGVRSVMLGGTSVGTTKGIALLAVPPGFVTVMGPVVAPLGTNVVMVVSETIVKGDAGTPLNVTAVAVAKPMPVIVNAVLTLPLSGVNVLMVGGASEFFTVKLAPVSSVPTLGTPPTVNGLDTVRAASGKSIPRTGVPPTVNGLDTVSAAPGSKVPVLGKPPVVNGLDTVRAASGSKVPVLGMPPVANGLDTVSAASGSKVPVLGKPPVVNGLRTVRAASGSRLPVLGKPPVLKGLRTVRVPEGSSAPWSVALKGTVFPAIVIVTTKSDGVTAVPAGVVTAMGPVVAQTPGVAHAPAVALPGTFAVIDVLEFTVNVVSGTPLNVTLVVPVKFIPAIVTVVPHGPLPGVMRVISGAVVAGLMIVVVSVTWLLPVLVSAPESETLAVLVMTVVPVTVGAVVTMVTAALALAANVPSEAVTVNGGPAETKQVPTVVLQEGVADISAGSTSVTETLSATPFPIFCTVTV